MATEPKEALVRALFDADNTARPDEHPEQMPAYIAKADNTMRWLGIHGFEIVASGNRTDTVRELVEALEDLLPPPLCGESWDLPDKETVSITVTLGKLKHARKVLSKGRV